MNAKINLASRPFRNRTLPWVITGVLGLVSLVALVFVVGQTRETNAKAAAVERDLRDLTQQSDALKQRAEQVTNAMTPEQQQVFQSAQGLVDRKRFSWSKLFADLEAALPGGVRVARINVRDVALRGEQTVAELELAVVERVPNSITGMIVDMDRAGVFRAEPLAQNLLKGRGETGTEWTLRVYYTPRAGAPLPANTTAGNIAASSEYVPTAFTRGAR